MDMFDLEGKVAVVTGGNGGIGLGMAVGLASAGAAVAVAARNTTKSGDAVATLRDAGAEAAAVAVDVTDRTSVQAMVADVVDRFGRIDVLVNNAGTDAGAGAESLTDDEWATVLDTNITGTHLCSAAVHPHLCAAGGGKIINIGSMMSLFGHGFAPAYAASKGAVLQYTRATACGWAPDNIQVNAVLPGWIDTDLTRAVRDGIPGLNDMVLNRTPASRWGRPADLAGVAVFLASGASDFVTGAAITVDGGYSVQG